MTEDQELERLKQAAPPPQRAPDPIPERTQDGKALSEDDMRHHSAARLVEQLDIVTGLAEHCERMVSIPSNDRIAPVYAAARLMTATALVAKALGALTHTETRHRQIIEQAKPLTTQNPHSNANLDTPAPPGPADIAKQAGAALDSLLFDTLQRKMLLYMNLHAARTFDTDLKQAYPELYEPAEAPAEAAPA